VEDGRHPELGDGVVERVVCPVGGVEVLQARMELEPTDAVLGHQATGRPHGGCAARRVDARERDQHVGVLRGSLRHVLVGDGAVPRRRFVVDREDDGGHRQVAIALGDLVDRRGAVVRLEVLRGGSHQLRPEGRVPVGVDLDVDVHVDGDEVRNVEPAHAGTSDGSCSPRLCIAGANVVGHACAIVSAVQPPSAYAVATGSGWLHSTSRSPPIPIA
jgi:hypothetical protein